MNLWKLLVDNFNKMPKWVQIVSWFLLLILAIYLYITPRFINGQMVVKVTSGGSVEYPGAVMRMFVEGRDLKFKTNEDGYWSIPVVSRLPFHAVHIQVYHEDAKAWFDINFDSKTVWTTSFGLKEIRLEVNSNPPTVEKIILAQSNFYDTCTRFVKKLISTSSAFADPQQQGEQKSNKEKTADQVKEIIARETGKNKIDIGREFRLTGENAPPLPQKLLILKSIEEKFKIKIPDEEWRAMVTSGELTEYLYSKQQGTNK